MARPLKYGEKTSVRSVTMPDSMWAALPEPKSQWVVEAVRQMQQRPLARDGVREAIELLEDHSAPKEIEVPVHGVDATVTIGAEGASIEFHPETAETHTMKLPKDFMNVPEPLRSEVPDPTCSHPKARQVNVVGGRKCLDCGKVKQTNGGWA